MSDYDKRPAWLDTGDNPQLHRRAQDRVLDDLCQKHGWRTIKALQDKVGTFGHRMKDDFGNWVVVVAKGSAFWKGIVSVQAFLPNECINWSCPLVMGFVYNPGCVRYWVFNPEEIKARIEGYNERRGVQFINFKLEIGVEAAPEHVWDVFDKLKKRPIQKKLEL